MPFSGPKWPIYPERISFDTNHYYFHLPIGPFHCAKFKKFLQQIQAKNGPFVPNKFFFEKLLISFSSTYQPLSLCKISKNFFQRNFWAQNSLFPQMRIFAENLLMSLVSFIHAYLHAKNQSQILVY